MRWFPDMRDRLGIVEAAGGLMATFVGIVIFVGFPGILSAECSSGSRSAEDSVVGPRDSPNFSTLFTQSSESSKSSASSATRCASLAFICGHLRHLWIHFLIVARPRHGLLLRRGATVFRLRRRTADERVDQVGRAGGGS